MVDQFIVDSSIGVDELVGQWHFPRSLGVEVAGQSNEGVLRNGLRLITDTANCAMLAAITRSQVATRYACSAELAALGGGQSLYASPCPCAQAMTS